MKKRSFTIDAIVVLPENLHCIWTLPLSDGIGNECWEMSGYFAVQKKLTRPT